MIISKVKRKRFRVDMAPLIDVVFLLLIFFMLTFAMQGQGMDLTLPGGSFTSDQVEEPLTIKIGNDNSIRVNSHPIPLDSLLDKIKEKVGVGKNKSIVIESGKKARYELFAQVLDVARQAGIKDFSIIRDVE
jgi:biopolymer transport protein ExbD